MKKMIMSALLVAMSLTANADGIYCTGEDKQAMVSVVVFSIENGMEMRYFLDSIYTYGSNYIDYDFEDGGVEGGYGDISEFTITLSENSKMSLLPKEGKLTITIDDKVVTQVEMLNCEEYEGE